MDGRRNRFLSLFDSAFSVPALPAPMFRQTVPLGFLKLRSVVKFGNGDGVGFGVRPDLEATDGETGMTRNTD